MIAARKIDPLAEEMLRLRYNPFPATAEDFYRMARWQELNAERTLRDDTWGDGSAARSARRGLWYARNALRAAERRLLTGKVERWNLGPDTHAPECPVCGGPSEGLWGCGGPLGPERNFKGRVIAPDHCSAADKPWRTP